MYSYTISNEANQKLFEQTCNKLEELYPEITFVKQIVDVDGSVVSVYSLDGREVVVENDYEIYAVYIDSQIELTRWPGKPLKLSFLNTSE